MGQADCHLCARSVTCNADHSCLVDTLPVSHLSVLAHSVSKGSPCVLTVRKPNAGLRKIGEFAKSRVNVGDKPQRAILDGAAKVGMHTMTLP
jgi:hypothetical protein